MKIRTIHVGTGGRGVWPVRSIAQRDDFESVALVDVKEEALAAARETSGLGENRCFGSMEEAVEKVEADAVIVITPPQLHASQCLSAVRSGKHVLVEKPFTLSLKDAQEVIREADTQGVCVTVAQNDRLGAMNVTIARLIREAVYGKAAFGLVTKYGWRPNTHHSGEVRHSYLWERGIHDLDTMRAIFSSTPSRVWGHSFNPTWSPYDHGAGSYAWIEFESGATCGYLCTFAAHAGGSSFRIECEGGALQVAGKELRLRRPGVKEDEIVPLDSVPSSDTVMLDNFHRYITEGVEPPFGGHENLKTIALIEAIGVASDEGRMVNFGEFCSD